VESAEEQPRLVAQLGHSGAVNALAVSNDHRLMATASADRTIRLWELETGREVRTFVGAAGEVWGVTFSPDGHRLLSSGFDSKVRLWEVETGQMLKQFDGGSYFVQFAGRDDRVLSGGYEVALHNISNEARLWHFRGYSDVRWLTTSRDGTVVYAGGDHEVIHVLDAETGKERRTLQAGGVAYKLSLLAGEERLLTTSRNSIALLNLGSGRIERSLAPGAVTETFALSGDGRRLVTARPFTHELQVWDFETGKLQKSMPGHRDHVMALTFVGDNRRVLSASRDGTARLWDAESGQELRRFVGQTIGVRSTSVSLEKDLVLLGSSGGVASVWDLAAGREALRLQGNANHTTAAISPDGKRVVIGGRNEKSDVWDLESRQLRGRFGEKIFSMESFQFLPGDDLVLWNGNFNDERASLWDVTNDLLFQSFRHPRVSTVRSLAFSADGRTLFACDEGGTARLWDTLTKEQRHCFTAMNGQEHVLYSAALNRVLTKRKDDLVHLFDGASGKLLHEFKGHFRTAAFSHEGRRLLLCDSLTIHLVDVEDGRELAAYPGFGIRDVRAAFLPSATQVLVATSDGQLRLLEAETGRELRRFDASSDGLPGLYISRDGLRFLTVGYEKTILRDVATGTALGVAQTASQTPWSFVFSPDLRHVVTINRDVAVTWELERGRPMWQSPLVHGKATALAYSPDGRVVAVGCDDGRCRLFDAKSGLELTRIDGRPGPICSIAFSANGQQLATGNDRGEVNLRNVSSGADLGRLRMLSEHRFYAVNAAAVSRDGRRVFTTSGITDRLWNVGETQPSWELEWTDPHANQTTAIAFLPDGTRLLTGDDAGIVTLRDVRDGKELRRFRNGRSAGVRVPLTEEEDLVMRSFALHEPTDDMFREVISISLPADGRRMLVYTKDGAATLWDLQTGRDHRPIQLDRLSVKSVSLSRDGRWALAGREDGAAQLWDVDTGRLVCSLVSLKAGAWAVIAPDGRFDTAQLEEVRGFHWIVGDDPLKTLSPEVFMRDYYEPRLLSRLLDPFERVRLPMIRSLSELNRVQPVVKMLGTEPDKRQDQARVTIEVSAAEGQFGRAGRTMRTGVYDVRLFRDGQLVGRWPEPPAVDDAEPEPDPTKPEDMAAWRAANSVVLDGQSKARKTFPVRLPRESGRGINFTAYAFSEDRVKSPTAYGSCRVPEGVPAAHPRAYLVTFGVAGFTDSDWDLRYSADDGRLAAAQLGKALEEAKHYELVRVVLATDRGATKAAPKPGEAPATAANLQAVLARLAGGPAEAGACEGIPGYAKLEPATPDDLVIVFASSHGYTDRKGAYYLFPSDIGPARHMGRLLDENNRSDLELLKACVSSGELSAWLRGVDAGQLALIVDCCHAAATVEQPGFKPGPMGSRGLGQLAYDKAMWVLAASQADDVALEALVKGEGHGLLTYALIRDGLLKKKAMRGDQLTLGGLLQYAESNVPKLYDQVVGAVVEGKGDAPDGMRIMIESRGGELVPLGGNAALPESTLRKKGSFQTPTLFDYARGRDVALGTKK
jgi:WD40 repeat protein